MSNSRGSQKSGSGYIHIEAAPPIPSSNRATSTHFWTCDFDLRIWNIISLLAKNAKMPIFYDSTTWRKQQQHERREIYMVVIMMHVTLLLVSLRLNYSPPSHSEIFFILSHPYFYNSSHPICRRMYIRISLLYCFWVCFFCNPNKCAKLFLPKLCRWIIVKADIICKRELLIVNK